MLLSKKLCVVGVKMIDQANQNSSSVTMDTLITNQSHRIKRSDACSFCVRFCLRKISLKEKSANSVFVYIHSIFSINAHGCLNVFVWMHGVCTLSICVCVCLCTFPVHICVLYVWLRYYEKRKLKTHKCKQTNTHTHTCRHTHTFNQVHFDKHSYVHLHVLQYSLFSLLLFLFSSLSPAPTCLCNTTACRHWQRKLYFSLLIAQRNKENCIFLCPFQTDDLLSEVCALNVSGLLQALVTKIRLTDQSGWLTSQVLPLPVCTSI